MLYQRMRSRTFIRSGSTPELDFPAQVEVLFEFTPAYVFGVEGGEGRTRVTWTSATQDEEIQKDLVACARINHQRGTLWAATKEPLTRLRTKLSTPTHRAIVDGNVLAVSFSATDREHLEREIARIYYRLPVLLNVYSGDPPAIARVEVQTSSGAAAGWIPSKAHGTTFPTNQHYQMEVVRYALFAALNEDYVLEPRLQAAVEYYYSAVRLIAAGETPGEFLGEAILNFAKILEVLFPAEQQVGSRAAARVGLASLGYTKASIETFFIPAILLRNELGIGHPRLVSVPSEWLEVIHDYVDGCENQFRQLLMKILRLPPESRRFLEGNSDSDMRRLAATVEAIKQNRLDFDAQAGTGNVSWPRV